MEKYGEISPKILEIMRMRGIDDENKLSHFLSPTDNDFYDPFLLKDMDRLTNRIKLAMQNDEKVLIFGDYDVDGVSATAVLYKYFESQNFHVDYFLPNRYVDGYGLTNEAILKIKEKYNPSLIITVDCGIASYKEVEFAKTLGIEIAVTDHHEVQEVLPSGIVVDPKIPGQDYPCSFLCGTGVAFKIVQALSGIEEAKKYLGIVAIATIADIVPLRDENRAIVKLGMQNFENTLPQGIKMLFAKCNMPLSAPSTDIAFKIAPKINAAGRMGDATVALKLYIKREKAFLKTAVDNLLEMNTSRQDLCNKVYDDAIKRLGKISLGNYNAIALYSKDWDSGILGIVAAKIAGEFNRPTVLFSEVDGNLVGSARSVNKIDIFEAISSIGEVLVAFGGHKMAAGLTIKKEDFASFISSLNNFLSSHYTPKDFAKEISYDMEILPSAIDEKFIKDLSLLEPTGCENPKPVFKTTLSEKATINFMQGHPKHLSISSDNMLFLAFSSCKYLPLLRQSNNRSITFEIQESEFRSKKYVKGIVKDFVSANLVVPREEICKGEYLKQLFYSKEKEVNVFYYDERNLKNYIKKAEKELFGTLFLSFSPQSFKYFRDLAGNSAFLEQVFSLVTNSGANAHLLAMDNFDNLGSYKKIVMLDSPLSPDYLSILSKNTQAKIYLPKETTIKKNLFEGLSFSRETFGVYYNLFVRLSQMKVPFVSSSGLFREMLKQNSKLSFTQFIFCLGVFLDLGIMTMESEDGINFITMSNIKKPLHTSKFYNKVKDYKK